MIKFLRYTFVFLVLSYSSSFANDGYKDYTYVEIDEFFTTNNNREESEVFYQNKNREIVDSSYSNAKIDLGSFHSHVYYKQPLKYYSKVTYTGTTKKLGNLDKNFIIQKNQILNPKRNNYNDITNLLAEQNELDVYYKKVRFTYGAKSFWILAPNLLVEKLDEIKNKPTKVRIYYSIIGKRSSYNPIIVLNDFTELESGTVTKEQKKRKKNQSLKTAYDIISIKVKKELYANALSLMQKLSEKYPDNEDLKIDICSIMSYKNNVFKEAEKCFQNLIEKGESGYKVYYGLGNLRFKKGGNNELNYEAIIKDITRVINILKITEKNPEILYQSYYLRAMTYLKLEKKELAITDLTIINIKKPELVSSGLIEKIREN